MFPAPFGHVKVKHRHKKWGSSSSSSSSSSGGGYNKAWKKEQKRQRKLMKKMAKHVCGFFKILELISSNLACKKGKGRPYSITERRVPELIPVLGS